MSPSPIRTRTDHPRRTCGSRRTIFSGEGWASLQSTLDGDLVGHAVAMDRFLEKAQRSLCISVLGEQKVNRLAILIHRAKQISPLPLDADVGLVHPPAHPDRALAAMEGLFQLGVVFQDPPVDRGVVHRHPTFLHQFFDMTVAQGIGQVPPDARQDNVLHKVGPLEADHDRALTRVVSRRTSGTDHTRNRAPRKICDRTPWSAWWPE